jgi:hypothetical protein
LNTTFPEKPNSIFADHVARPGLTQSKDRSHMEPDEGERDPAFEQRSLTASDGAMLKRLEVGAQALIVALGACPLLPGLLGVALNSAAGCQLSDTAPIACVVLGHDVGSLLYGMATSVRFAVYTLPLAILAVFVWRIVLYFTNRHRRIEVKNSKDAVLKFPEPLTIGPPMRGHRFWLVLSALIAVGFANNATLPPFDKTSILVTVFFGVVTMIIVAKLIPGSTTLTLDANGFETTRWFWRRRFRWNDVSGFSAWGSGESAFVAFKDKTLRLGPFGKLRAALSGGANRYLFGAYGTSTDELAWLLRRWQRSALRAAKQAQAEATAGQVEAAPPQKTSVPIIRSVRALLKELRPRRRLLSR